MMAGEGMPVHTYGSSEEMHNLIEADPLLATESKFSEQPEEAALESARGGAKTEADDDDAENSKLSAAAAAASNSAHHSEAVQSMQQEATAATTGTAGADLNRVPSLFAQIEAPFKICYAVWLFLLLNAVLASWLLHLPLLTGRAALAAVKLPSNNDIFNFPTGLALLWGCLYVVRFVIQDVMHNWNTPALLRALCKWTTIAAKVLAVGLLWLLVPPMLLGLLLESLCLIPLRTPLMETPQFPLLQCWAVGLILLKVWIRLESTSSA